MYRPTRSRAAAPKKRVAKRPAARKSAPARRKQPNQMGQLIRAIGKLAGSAVGNAVGGPAGGAIGGMVGSAGGGAISRIMGHGDYRVTRNSLVHPTKTDQIPGFGDGRGGTRIRHREYIKDILSSTLFTNDEFTINPSNRKVFPWLSKIASNYEQWQAHGMVFEFRSLYSDAVVAVAGATGSLGAVVLSTEYNALAERFQTKQQMENTQFVTSTKPSLSVLHPIECARSQTSVDLLYIRLPESSPNSDLGDARLYDLGNFQLATQGIPEDNTVIGELWVSYDITLHKPILDTVFESLYSRFTLGQVQAGIAAGEGLLGATANRVALVNALQLTAAGPSLQFPAGSAGQYFISLSWSGVANLGPANLAVANNFVNCAVVPFVFDNAASSSGAVGEYNANVGVTVTRNMRMLILNIINPSIAASVDFTLNGGAATGWPADASFGNLYVMSIGATSPTGN